METLTTRASMWLALLASAVFAAAMGHDTAYSIQMMIVAVAAGIALWWTLYGSKIDSTGTWLRAPNDETKYDDDPVRWGVIATMFWGVAGLRSTV